MTWQTQSMGIEILWTFAATKNLTAAPALSSDLLVVAGRDKCVRALNLHDGSERWRLALSRAGGGAFATSDMVIIGDETGAVHRIDARTAAVVWTTVLSEPVAGQPVLWGEQVLVNAGGTRGGQVGGGLYALDVESGDERWHVPAELGARCRPTIVDDLAIQVTLDGEVMGITPAGEIQWRHLGAGPTYVPIAASAKHHLVVVKIASGGVGALDTSTGQMRWTAQTSLSLTGGLICHDDSDTVIAATNDGHVVGHRFADGALQWKTSLEVGSHGAPLGCVVNNRIVVASERDDRTVCRLLSIEGDLLHEVPIGGSTPGQVVGKGDLCVVTSAHGQPKAVLLQVS